MSSRKRVQADRSSLDRKRRICERVGLLASASLVALVQNILEEPAAGDRIVWCVSFHNIWSSDEWNCHFVPHSASDSPGVAALFGAESTRLFDSYDTSAQLCVVFGTEESVECSQLWMVNKCIARVVSAA